MRKGLIFNKLVFTTLTFVVLGMILISCADAGMYETLQRDGKLRVIVKFKQFVADSISYKLGEDGEAYGDLNEYVLRKIDTKYNLKKLEKLYKDRDNSDNPNSYSRQLDDYFVIEVDKDEDDAELVCRGLESLFEVDAVEQDIKVNISVEPLPDVDYIPNDYYVSFDGLNWSSYMWGLQKVQVFEAWDLFSDAQTEPGRDIVVAVIDTGVNFSHPDISANKWINTSEIPGNGVDDDGNGYIDDINGWDFVSNDNNPSDVHGHGTHCSGTIAGVTNNTIGVAGISPNTRIMAVKGLNDYGSGYISWLSNCIIYAADNGADVLSNSWGGGGSSSTLTTAVNYAHAKGCLVVAAAGNSNTNVSGFMPANIPNAIAVAATDRNDVKAYFSNYGPGIDISAPGVAILSTVGAGYSSWSGTSMACPHVSGIAALMFSIDPNLTNTEIREKLKSTADNIDAENPSWQGQLGTGRVNAYKAILSCDSGRHSPILEPIGNKTIEEGSALSFVVNASDEDGDALIYSVAGLPGGLVSSGDARFYLQSETAYEGTRALQSGSITENEISIVTKELDMSSDGEVSFYWKVSSLQDDGKLGFYVDGIKRSEISGMTEWQEFSLTLNKGSYLLSWKYTKETDATAGQDAGWIDFIKVTMGEDLTYDFEDGHMPDEFTTGGDGTFHVQSPYAHTGYYSIMGEQITDNQSQYLETTIETGADSEISFWCQVASEYYYDYFKFYIDGVLKVQISGIVSWHRQSFSLGPGTHTLKWEYVKDYSVRAGMDTAWIDDIVIKNANQETINFEQVQGEPNPLPNGASFDSDTRTFTWTPTYDQAGTYPKIRFIVTEDTDEARYDYEDITIFVRDLNLPPILESIGDKIVAELSPLEFTVVANDPEGDELIYSATNLPQGAVFDADTQIFTWTPGSRQSGSYENVRFQVSDGNSGGGGETEEPAPIGGETKLLLRFDANLDDSSSSNHVAQLHGNAALDDSVYNVGQGSLSLDGSEDYLDIPDSEDWYFGTNDFTVDFWVRLSSLDNCGFVAQKSDGGHGWRLHYEYGYVQFFAYTGSSGTKIGPWTFPWNPSEDTWYHLAFARGGNDFKCYVDDVEIGFVRTSANPMPDISAPLRVGAYPTLGGGGWSAYLDGNIDELRVSHADLYAGSNDNALAGALAAEVSSTSENTVYEDITITVLDLNHAPVLTDPGNKSVNEGETLQFTITATDPDGDTLTYALTNIQEGASFDSATRTFTWTPGYDQAGTTYLGITVSDGALTDYEEIYITVVDKNRAPILSPIGNKFIGEGATLLFTISATDTDEDEIIYSAEGLPAGAVFDSATQIFTWTPSEGAADTYEGIRFIASDGSLTDAEEIRITVYPTGTELTIVKRYEGNFQYPRALTLDHEGNVLIADTGGVEIVKLSSELDYLDTYSGYSAWGLGVSSDGNIYMVDSEYRGYNPPIGPHRILRLNSDYSDHSSFGDLAGTDNAHLYNPSKLDIDSNGNLYIADESNNRILKIDSDLSYITQYPITRPYAIAVHGENLYVANCDGEIAKLDIALTELILEKDLGNSGIADLAVNSSGYIFVATQGRMMKLNSSLEVLSVYSNEELYKNVNGIDIDDQGYIYIIDYYEGVAKLQEAGVPAPEDPEDPEEPEDPEDPEDPGDPTNNPPVLSPIGNKSVNEMSLLEFAVIATDPDGDDLTYSASNLPTGAAFNSDTRTFSWIPTYEQSGTYQNVRFEVSDGPASGTIDENTRLLLQFNSNDFTDESQYAHSTALHGNAEVDSTAYKWGSGSLRLDGSNSFAAIEDSSDWYFGADDFTIDFWVKLDYAQNAGFIAQKDSSGHGWRLHYEYGYVQFFAYTGSRTGKLGPWAFRWDAEPDTWHHVAFTRVDNNFTCFADGEKLSTSKSSTNPMPDINADLRIGAYPTLGTGGWSSYLAGNIDELRISLGNPYEVTQDSTTISLPAAEVSGQGLGSLGGGNTVYEEITITVNDVDVNDAPVLNAIGDKEIDEGDTLSFTLTANDPDGDTLSYSVENLPEGALLNSSSGLFTWTPTFKQAGMYPNIVFTVSDGEFTDSEEIKIKVWNVNRKPVIESVIASSSTIAEGETLTITITATDLDGDTLTYSVQNGPEGSGFVDNDFYWVPGYEQAGTYPDITFTVYDGFDYSDPSDPITITVTNARDVPLFITQPEVIASYTSAGEAKNVVLIGDYAYIAYGGAGLKVLSIADLDNIYEVDAVAGFSNLSRIVISGDYAYLLDTGIGVKILDISTPALPAIKGTIAQADALDIAVNNNISYIATGEELLLYDITDPDLPYHLNQYDSLGKADKLIMENGYLYVASEEHDLTIIDADTLEVLSQSTIEDTDDSNPEHISLYGTGLYLAKSSVGIGHYDTSSLSNPESSGVESITGKTAKSIEPYTKNRSYSIMYAAATNEYSLHCLDTVLPPFSSEIDSWPYTFDQGVAVNSFYVDGNRLLAATTNGLEILASPIEAGATDAYTIQTGKEFKLTIYASDPDDDSVTYTINNKPDLTEAVFTDNGDGTATLVWTPTEEQLGTYENISFIADDSYQEATSGTITINVVNSSSGTPIDENTKLLLQFNGTAVDESPSEHDVVLYGGAEIDASLYKWGTGSIRLNGRYDHLYIPDSPDWHFSTNDFTIDFWINYDSVNDSGFIAQKDSSGHGWRLHYEAGYIQLFAYTGSRATKLGPWAFPWQPEPDTWYHIAFIRTGNTFLCFVDGQRVGVPKTSSNEMPDISSKLRLGAYPTLGAPGWGAFLEGNMDEVRVSHSNIFGVTADSDTIPVPREEAN